MADRKLIIVITLMLEWKIEFIDEAEKKYQKQADVM